MSNPHLKGSCTRLNGSDIQQAFGKWFIESVFFSGFYGYKDVLIFNKETQ